EMSTFPKAARFDIATKPQGEFPSRIPLRPNSTPNQAAASPYRPTNLLNPFQPTSQIRSEIDVASLDLEMEDFQFPTSDAGHAPHPRRISDTIELRVSLHYCHRSTKDRPT